MTLPAAAVPPSSVPESANALLTLLARRSRGGVYEGFLSRLGAELDLSPTRVSRAVRALEAAGRVEVLQRGHGRHPSRLRVVRVAPLTGDPGARPARPALADRLLEHLGTLSSGGFVERPLVEVAKELDVGAPSVSRALGRLVEEGRARVDQVGTRSRPTRIALVPVTGDGGIDGEGEDGVEGDDGSAELAVLRAENQRLAAEVARLRAQLGRRPAG